MFDYKYVIEHLESVIEEIYNRELVHFEARLVHDVDIYEDPYIEAANPILVSEVKKLCALKQTWKLLDVARDCNFCATVFNSDDYNKVVSRECLAQSKVKSILYLELCEETLNTIINTLRFHMAIIFHKEGSEIKKVLLNSDGKIDSLNPDSEVWFV